MVKIFLIVALFFAVGCMTEDKSHEHKVMYDEASLKAFVLSTHDGNESAALNKLDSVLKNASTDSVVFRQTVSFLETPFSNPNSSYRNQSLYARLLNAQVKSKWYSAYEKEVAGGRLKLLQQNNVGNAANDFTYTTPAGYKKKMYDINSNYILLYFNNPDCHACKQMRDALSASSVIDDKLKTGDLTILSIYTDQDEKLWLDHLNEFPPRWIQGRDNNEFLYKNKVYDLRAIPTIYLLDSDKKVLLKDVMSVLEIEEKLKKHE